MEKEVNCNAAKLINDQWNRNKRCEYHLSYPHSNRISEIKPRFWTSKSELVNELIRVDADKKDIKKRHMWASGNKRSSGLNTDEKNKVLVIDDDPSIKELLKIRLEGDYEVTTASEGAEGLNRVVKECPDLVLLDIKLPNDDGITILTEIKRDYPDISVIMMTAYGSEEIAVEAMKKGADEYLTKPLNYREINRKVKESIIPIVLNVTTSDSISSVLQVIVPATKKTGIMETQGDSVSIKKSDVSVALFKGSWIKSWFLVLFLIPRKM